jgi:hypothetical protein
MGAPDYPHLTRIDIRVSNNDAHFFFDQCNVFFELCLGEPFWSPRVVKVWSRSPEKAVDARQYFLRAIVVGHGGLPLALRSFASCSSWRHFFSTGKNLARQLLARQFLPVPRRLT